MCIAPHVCNRYEMRRPRVFRTFSMAHDISAIHINYSIMTNAHTNRNSSKSLPFMAFFVFSPNWLPMVAQWCNLWLIGWNTLGYEHDKLLHIAIGNFFRMIDKMCPLLSVKTIGNTYKTHTICTQTAKNDDKTCHFIRHGEKHSMFS